MVPIATDPAAEAERQLSLAPTAASLVPQPRLPPIFRTRLTKLLGIDHPIMVRGWAHPLSDLVRAPGADRAFAGSLAAVPILAGWHGRRCAVAVGGGSHQRGRLWLHGLAYERDQTARGDPRR